LLLTAQTFLRDTFRSDVSGRRNSNAHRLRARFTAAIVSALVGLQLNLPSGSALAATEVRGRPDNIELGAQNSSVKEVLETLAAHYKLIYQVPANLPSDLTIQCSGTLQQILERVLDGNDYILKVSEDSMEVVVLGVSGATAVAIPGPVITVNKSTTPSPTSSTSVARPALPESKPAPPLTSYLSQVPAGSTP
jgi:hypothetical protein